MRTAPDWPCQTSQNQMSGQGRRYIRQRVRRLRGALAVLSPANAAQDGGTQCRRAPFAPESDQTALARPWPARATAAPLKSGRPRSRKPPSCDPYGRHRQPDDKGRAAFRQAGHIATDPPARQTARQGRQWLAACGRRQGRQEPARIECVSEGRLCLLALPSLNQFMLI